MTQTKEMFAGLAPPASFAADSVIEDLGDGLVMRHAGPDDHEALAGFNRIVHADPPEYRPADVIARWTRDLMSGHPRVVPRDFVLVHDTKAERLAATLMLLSHRFRYGAVELEVGQPELVGTHPEYRRRGLVRRMFDVVHGWSAERGQKLQIIGGIPWYYRQFGYDMALEHGVEWRAAREGMPAEPPSGEQALRTRAASYDDIPLLESLEGQRAERHRVSCLRDEGQWRYEIDGGERNSEASFLLGVIERPDGSPVAAYAHRNGLRAGWLQVGFFEVAAGTPNAAVTRPLLGELRQRGEEYAKRDDQPFLGAGFFLGREHPLYDVARGRIERQKSNWALYVRVPDLVDFIRHVAPELERRLGDSAFAGQRGVLELSLYRTGVRIAFEDGRIARVEPWQPDTGARGHVAFPDLSFLQLLMGFRSLGELEAFYPDCLILHEQRGALVDALFPVQQSCVWATY